MKKTAKGIVVILAAVMFVLCFSTQGSAKVNNRAKKLTKEFTNYAAYMAVYKGGTTKNFSSSSARKQVCAQNERYCNGDSLEKVHPILQQPLANGGRIFRIYLGLRCQRQEEINMSSRLR